MHSLGKTLLALIMLILYSKIKLVCYPRFLLTSYFWIPFPYDEKNIFLFIYFFIIYLCLIRSDNPSQIDDISVKICCPQFTLCYQLFGCLSSKESDCQAGDMGLIPGSGGSPEVRNGNPLQYSCLGNPMEPGGLQSTGSKKSQT